MLLKVLVYALWSTEVWTQIAFCLSTTRAVQPGEEEALERSNSSLLVLQES